MVFTIAQGARGSLADEKKTSLIFSPAVKLLNFLSLERLCRNDENAAFVILNEVKNLMHSIRYTAQILRLSPQDDIATQSPRGERTKTLELRSDDRIFCRIGANSSVRANRIWRDSPSARRPRMLGKPF
jgi:hypothetical protein